MTWLSGLLLASLARLSVAQLSGSIGPTTSTASKRAIKTCNIMDYGGVANRTANNGPAITAAWNACRAGGEVYIPAGEYGLYSWAVLNGGKHIGLNIDGTIFRTGTGPGNMFLISNSDDIEVYSGTGLGAIQGFGYEFHKVGTYGPRIMRVQHCTNFAVHDFVMVDSPKFHLTLDNSTNGEVYNMVIHGGHEGGLDGIDVWGSNIWVHDVEVSNRDECVTVKTDHDSDISNIVYRNVYTHHSNNLYLFKSRGGSGSVTSVQLENFIGHSNAYGLSIDTDWIRQEVGAGPGVFYSDINVVNWNGTSRVESTHRDAIRVLCPAEVPCTRLNIENVHIVNDDGSNTTQLCQNAFGAGACLAAPGHTKATRSDDVSVGILNPLAAPLLPNELPAPFDVSQPIPIPVMPVRFFPGIAPKRPIRALTHALSQSLKGDKHP
ncbi:hypothetical protein E4U55_002114 [Claviceps digitariae]|nr:hypothetical protein E4U55_002114 [Claviceps digitariae]